MSTRLKVLVALWFVAQITLPFTAPLQTVDLTDLFGQQPHHQATQITPELCSVPTPARRPTIVTPLKLAPIGIATAGLTPPRELTTGSFDTSAFGFMTSPRLQQTVLRI